MDKSEVTVTYNRRVTDGPRVVIVRHNPSGEMGVGAGSSSHEAKNRAIEMLARRLYGEEVPPELGTIFTE